MWVQCPLCSRSYDDTECWTICPHGPLWAGADAYCREHDLVNCFICKERKSAMANQFVQESGWPQTHGEPSTVTFTVQSGPIKEYGINGCQIDDVIAWAKDKIEGFNKAFPCRENSVVVTKLDEALLWLMKRKMDREKRQVEGTNAA